MRQFSEGRIAGSDKQMESVKKGKRSVSSLAMLLLLFLAFSAVACSKQAEAEWRLVTRVVDGDTIIVGERERVRLIGVDTPETKHPQRPVEYFGREATAFTRKMVQGKRVRLEFDQANSHIGHKDKYRRTLAYVFLDDGTFLNAEITKQGYGHGFSRPVIFRTAVVLSARFLF